MATPQANRNSYKFYYSWDINLVGCYCLKLPTNQFHRPCVGLDQLHLGPSERTIWGSQMEPLGSTATRWRNQRKHVYHCVLPYVTLIITDYLRLQYLCQFHVYVSAFLPWEIRGTFHGKTCPNISISPWDTWKLPIFPPAESRIETLASGWSGLDSKVSNQRHVSIEDLMSTCHTSPAGHWIPITIMFRHSAFK
jgi:hypothetical protein